METTTAIENGKTVDSGENEINLFALLHRLLGILRRLWFIPLIAGLLAGGIFSFVRWRTYVPVYEARAVFSVSGGYTSTADVLAYSPYDNTATTKQIIATFPYIIKTEAMDEMLIERLGQRYRDCTLAASSIADSILVLTSTCEDPATACDALAAIIEFYPRLAATVIGNAKTTVMEDPTVPTAPKNPLSPARDFLLGFFVGALLVCACFFVSCLFNRTVQTREDLTGMSNLRCLGYIPCISFKRRARKKRYLISILDPACGDAFAESVRTLRTRLLQRLGKGQCPVIMVTSTVAREGKTTVAANLALSLSNSGKRVAIIGGDLHSDSLREFFRVKNVPSPGLAGLLTESSKTGQTPNVFAALLRVDNTNVCLLPAGSETGKDEIPYLHTSRVAAILDALRPRFDFILIDTPPCGLLEDAAAFAPVTSGALYVVRRDYASRNQIYDGIGYISHCGAKLLGCVLNQTESDSDKYGYGYGYGYGSYGAADESGVSAYETDDGEDFAEADGADEAETAFDSNGTDSDLFNAEQ